MKKGMFLLLLIVLLVFSMAAFAVNNASGQGQRNAATPANKGQNGEPATPAHKATEIANNLLSNPFFIDPLSQNAPDDQGNVNTEGNWIFFTNSGAQATFELDRKVAKIIPTNINAPAYGIQLIQAPLKIENLGIYRITLRAKSDTPRNIAIKVGATGNKGWTAYSQSDLSLTTDMKTYTYEFTMRGETDPNARFEFFFAQSLAPVWIEQISLERIGTAVPEITMDDLMKRTKTEADENAVEEWQLLWSDEFDGPSINLENWTFETGNGADKSIPGWGNNELEYYTDSTNNAFIEDGNLVIQALKEQRQFNVNDTDYTTEYTSARLVTQDKVFTTYGRIETRAILPKGQGIWPAFWMLGQNIGTVGWPSCGEIDILEYIGSKATEIHGTVHGTISAGPGINGHVDLGIDLSEDYHVYAIEWDEDEVEFYLDDVLYHVVNKDEVALEVGPEDWVYDHDHFLILNLAVGGNWPGAPDDTTDFPKRMVVDYVRIYKDVNTATIDGQEVIDSEYERPAQKPGFENLVNGDFASGKEGWNSYFHFDASGTFNVVDGMAVITTDNNGLEEWSIQLYQGTYKCDSTKKYTLTFDARTEIPRDMTVVIDNAGYYRFVNEKVNLTTTMNTYQFTFSGINDEVSLKFLLGELGNAINGTNSITIDNVKIEILE